MKPSNYLIPIFSTCQRIGSYPLGFCSSQLQRPIYCLSQKNNKSFNNSFLGTLAEEPGSPNSLDYNSNGNWSFLHPSHTSTPRQIPLFLHAGPGWVSGWSWSGWGSVLGLNSLVCFGGARGCCWWGCRWEVF